MRLLVTGHRGQLGTELMRVCATRGIDATGVDVDTVDVTDRDAVAAAVAAARPDAVIHGAAWTAVDACESDPDKAFRANATAVRWVAEACAAAGAHLVHVSTDYVFDGTKPTPYVETDAPNPRSVYGHSKLAGEVEALKYPAAAVARTSWVCGAAGGNMVKTVLRLAREGKPLAFVSDQTGHPTFTSDLAPALLRLAADRRTGLYHVTNQCAVSWCEFVREIVRLTGGDPATVRPITTAELDPPRPAPRPANSVLADVAWRAAGYPPLRDFRAPLAELLAELG
ncbi:MAG: dTDP-4-dehydrorhamnose reductase [Planctomycetaceae bacterium]